MTWKEYLRNNITTSKELQPYLDMSEQEQNKLDQILNRYPMMIPEYYLNLIDWTDPEDPIRRLCIPNVQEFDLSGSLDTSGEESNTKLKGLQHKYRQTALILSTSKCAMYCRHCFRKRLVGKDSQSESSHDVTAQAEYIRQHPEINNVLISGGDSLLNDNAVIEDYLRAMMAIPHVQLIRFGTRTPVVFPMRITEDPELLDLFERYNAIKPIYIVTHFNHPHEISEQSQKAIKMLRERGLIVRNQTVLLRGINDDCDTLAELLNGLTAMGVIPYYVFQCRPVTGVKNQFQIPILRGVDIVEGARRQLNGQGRSFRYAMSHPTGKIEICGKMGEDSVILKYHQAKDPERTGVLVTQKLSEDQCWLDFDPMNCEA